MTYIRFGNSAMPPVCLIMGGKDIMSTYDLINLEVRLDEYKI
ncbi:hypothetical protein [Aminipila terrae]|nr:hypothetical protein [Aminipila terrae]